MLRLLKIRTEAAKKSFMLQGPACYNEVPIDTKKRELVNYFQAPVKGTFTELLGLISI